MFGSLARRLTGWYVFVAVALVVLLAGAVIVAGLILYARDANEQIAKSDRADFAAAKALLLRRLARPGLLVQVLPPPPGIHALPHGEFGIFRYPDRHSAPESHAGRPGPGPEFRPFFGNRFGFVAATSLGIRSVRPPYMGGVAIIFVDVDRVQGIVEIALTVLLVTGLLAGLVAWTIGRYITSQAMRPLYDVTSALVRFAGRDFSVKPIDVAGRTEFDGLVRAYNAAADQVANAFAERAAAEAQMRQFVADAGHELRTPLTIVLGYIDMLKRRAPDDERSRRIFDTIAIEGSRMRTLIDNLVLLARLEGQGARAPEPFALTPLLEKDVVQTRRGIAPGVQWTLDIGVEATIIGDRSELYEAIANIVDNALKYAPGSAIEIRVAAAAGGVEIAVTDHGPGIPAVDRESIFDRFSRGSQRGDVEGSGLGLAIAKRAIERAGGTLTLAQTSETGTTFTIRLRADQVAPRFPAAPEITV
jgi:two-component system OmpR family sensor kinase